MRVDQPAKANPRRGEPRQLFLQHVPTHDQCADAGASTLEANEGSDDGVV